MIDKKLFENNELVGKACIIHDVFFDNTYNCNVLEDHYFTDITNAELIIDYNKKYYWMNGLEFIISYRDNISHKLSPYYEMSFFDNDGTPIDLESMTIEVLSKEEVIKHLDERIHKWFNVKQ